MRRWPIALVAAATLLIGGCDEDKPVRPGPARTTTSQAGLGSAVPGVAPSASASPGSPSDIRSEQQFRQLLLLAPDKAPPHRGVGLVVGKGQAYLALPKEGQPPLPGLVLIHDRWGLDDHIKRWAERFSADGYATLAVDLYGGTVAKLPAEADALMAKVDEKEARQQLLDAYTFLAEDDRIKAPKRGAIGWCLGGHWAVELALAAPQLDAVVVYYGHLSHQADQLAALEAPLLGLWGKQDDVVDSKTVQRFEFGLEQAGGKRYQLLSLEGGHGFANPSRPGYAGESAATAWRKVRGFLHQHLREPPDEAPGRLPSRP
jgi:carboxymethylenebutenolidase